jgi:hypothetical protein
MPHCARDTFTPEQYHKHEESFWALPRSWVAGSHPLLARLWQAGRGSPTGLLPLFGQFPYTHRPEGLFLSVQEMARLLAQAPNTILKGARILEDPFALVTQLDRAPGEIASRWRIHPSIAADRGKEKRFVEYFHFPARWIYGGQWGLLTDPERQLLLCVAAMSHLRWEEPISSHELDELNWATDRSDLQASWESNELAYDGGRGNAYRIAVASSSELATATALGRTSISKVLANWQQTHLQGPWTDHRDRRGRPIVPERQLVRVYPLRTGRYLFHFRDHVGPWPFPELNEHLGLSASGDSASTRGSNRSVARECAAR